jgi:hypothetical protein
MWSSPEGILIAILVALAPANEAAREPGSGAASAAAEQQIHADVSRCQRFADGVTRRNCVARIVRPEGENITPDTQFPTRVNRIAPIDPGMPSHLRLVRSMP